MSADGLVALVLKMATWICFDFDLLEWTAMLLACFDFLCRLTCDLALFTLLVIGCWQLAVYLDVVKKLKTAMSSLAIYKSYESLIGCCLLLGNDIDAERNVAPRLQKPG